MLANCNYAIVLGKKMSFSLVGISGEIYHLLIILLSFSKGQDFVYLCVCLFGGGASTLNISINFLITGQDIWEGNKTLTLALTWQLMRAHTLSLLKRDITIVSEECLFKWANEKVKLHKVQHLKNGTFTH